MVRKLVDERRRNPPHLAICLLGKPMPENLRAKQGAVAKMIFEHWQGVVLEEGVKE